MKKKITSLLLIIATLITLVACAPKVPPTETDPQEGEVTTAPVTEVESLPETTPEEQKKGVTLFEDGKWNFRIVTKSVRSQDEIDFSFALSQAMSTLTGKAPHTANDIAIKPDDVCEIIIGHTKHPIMASL